jgi:hypothetical protein
MVVVLPATVPIVNKPEDDMLPGPELTDQLGDTDCELPSLNRAEEVNWPELFSFTEFGPLMARDVNTGATCAIVIL